MYDNKENNFLRLKFIYNSRIRTLEATDVFTLLYSCMLNNFITDQVRKDLLNCFVRQI